MAQPNATKQALASAMKKLMKKTAPEKISVTDICRECSVNRKSFYYHFQDKYDLINWIFDSEFERIAAESADRDGLRAMLRLLEHLYEDRSFYRRALQIKGQNSFTDHFRELLVSSIRSRFGGMFSSEVLDFRIGFYADALVCTIHRWLTGRDTMPPGKLFSLLTACLDSQSEPHCLSEGQTA